MLHLLFNRFSEISSWEDSATLPSDVAWGLTIEHEGRWGLSTRNLRDSFSVKRPRHIWWYLLNILNIVTRYFCLLQSSFCFQAGSALLIIRSIARESSSIYIPCWWKSSDGSRITRHIFIRRGSRKTYTIPRKSWAFIPWRSMIYIQFQLLFFSLC